MEYILYSDSLRRFSSNFQKNVNSTSDCFERLNESIELIADDINLGRFDIRIEAPESIYDAEGYLIDYPVYRRGDDYGNAPLQFPYETYEHGHILIRVFPRKNYTWSEQEREALGILARNVFFMCGRARLIDLMKKIVVTDNVTGIPNLTGFKDFARRIRDDLPKYHAVCVNIKNFKFINRTISARRSDVVLHEYARYIERHMSENEIFARIAGDSFVGLVMDENIHKFLNKISNVKLYADKECRFIQINSRAGVYDVQIGDTVSDIMGYIDAALNVAREQNEDHIFFEHSMMEKMLKGKEVSALFPVAIAKKQFEVFYQPKVNILNNELCGCEALVRWNRKGSIVPPMEFIPVLENEGTICQLDFYVFESVCETIRSWVDRGVRPVTVSVNFSRIHLKNPNVADKIFSIIDKYNIDTKYVEIELTEMSGYDNYENLSAFIKTMRERGVHTSIDDFGTGYSSLNLLTDLDVDVVKLDKSYSIRLNNNEEKTKILIHNIVNMVHELGFKVIAEGVETEEQADFLRDIGCSTVQGYLFDKPLPLADFEQRLIGKVKYTV